ncbi:MAG: amino acid adenylation domain-containing protein, partial [Calditrichales bacterium]|nr:amino acid adenylation domain-containing protein [Calditrichales bacterium]
MSDISKRLSNLSPEKLELLRKKLKKEGKAVKKDVIVKRQNQADYPMSAAQKRLWFLNQLDPESAFYNIPSALRLKGSLNVPVLEKSINEIVKRHEVLRASFHIDDKGEAQQIISGELIVPLNQLDISDIPADKTEAKVQQLLKDKAAAVFKLDQAPLMRVSLIKLNSGEYVLIINMHHIIADGWSIGVFIQEVIMLYQAFAANLASPLKDLKLQFFDYAQWQEDRQNEEVINKQLSYWTEYLKGMPARLELPVDHPRPSLASYKGKQHIFSVGKELTGKLRKLTKENNVSLYMTLMSAFQTFLYKFSNQDDFGVGAPIANRNRKEIEEIIGFFVNTIVLRANFTKDITFLDLINRVRNDVLEASANQDVPFEKIVETILPKRELSVSPLFQVMFDLQKAPLQSMKLKELTLEIVDIEIEVAKFDLLFIMLEYEDDIKCTLEYNTDLFDTVTIERIAGYFSTLLTNIVRNPAGFISDLSLISVEEKNYITSHWNKTQTNYPFNYCVHELFEKQANLTPQSIALSFEGTELTYAELNSRTNQLARYLKRSGIGPDKLVGLYTERSIESIIAILGILKAGGAYLPLDPEYPLDRLKFMLNDAQSTIILTQSHLKERLPVENISILCLDIDWDKFKDEKKENLHNTAIPENLIYVMYTSGSTGIPKGVSITHKSVVRLVKNTNYVKFSKDDKFLQLAPISFDASTLEIWGSLLNGAKLIIMPPGKPSLQELADKIINNKVSFLWLTAGLFHLMVDEQLDAIKTVRQLLAGGDVLSVRHVNKLLQRFNNHTFINGYGPTENTTFTCCHPMETVEKIDKSVPIGRPISNTQTYILDRYFHTVPIGSPGELFIGGVGLARDYYNRPNLTAEKFVPNPFSDKPGKRLYKTGDLVRYLADGNIEFLGRIDQQVKIRGFRIELGEIEALLRKHSALKDAVVIAHEDMPGDKQLAAYIVPQQISEIPDNETLRLLLSEKLPDYMIPAFYIPIDKVPITPNGKVDRKALPAPDKERFSSKKDYVPPRTELEKLLIETWQEILGIDKIGIYDNFFDLGGNSLKAAVFANRLQKELDEVVHVGAIFKAPLIAELAMYIAEYYPDSVEKNFGIKAEASHKYGVKIENAEDIEKIDNNKIYQFRGLITPLPPQTTSRAQKNPPAVFLLSPPRSGSTLLRIMMAGNPKLFSPPELDLLSFNALQERKSAFSQDGLEIWLEATIRAIMEIKEYDAAEAKRIMSEYERQNLTTNEFFGLMQEWVGGRYIVDKTPTYAFDPEILKRMETGFENPLYIHLIRHPYAMIYSFIEAKLDKNFFRHSHPFSRHELAELIWIISNQNTINFLKNIPAQRQFRLKFESLLADPRHELENLCNFLNIEFAEEMLKPYQGKKMTDGVTSNSQMVGDFKFYLHKNINAGVAEKWKKFHTHDFLSDISWKLAEEFGYAVEKDLARKLTLEKHEALTKIMPAPRDKELTLSFAQQRLWFLDQMDPGNPQYNIPGAIRLKGSGNIPVLEQSLNKIIERHETLRTIFTSSEDGKASQKILPKLSIKLDRVDLSKLPEDKKEKETLSLANKEARKPFNLATGPLIRAQLVQLSQDEFVLIMVLHHIISDGWSVNLFVQELSAGYSAFTKGRPFPLADLPIQYIDYAAWQRGWLTGETLDLQMNFWKKQLAGMSPYLELPTDYARPPVVTSNGTRRVFHIKADLFKALQKLTNEKETTLFISLLTAFQTLMFRYSRQEDFAVGTPVANRMRSE